MFMQILIEMQKFPMIFMNSVFFFVHILDYNGFRMKIAAKTTPHTIPLISLSFPFYSRIISFPTFMASGSCHVHTKSFGRPLELCSNNFLQQNIFYWVFQ